MASHATRAQQYDFANPQVLTNMFANRSGAGGSVTQVTDYVKLTDDAALGFDVTNVAGFLAADIKRVEFLVKASAAAPSGLKAFFGLADKPATSPDNDPDSLANAVGLWLDGAAAGGAIKARAIAGANDTGYMDSGEVLGTAWKRIVLDLWENHVTVSPPGQSTSGRSSVVASVGNADEYLRKVKTSAHLDMDSYTAQLQPLVLVSDATLDIHVREICIQYAIR